MTQINKLDGNVKSFAVACYDTNSIEDLKNSLNIGADAIDCKEWGISENEWNEAVNAAISDLQADTDE